ncbi:heme-degrading monooxygenase HmoA [Pseudoduganella flava]|uniref:Antibiotic biosynthesis monooxygenase n=1 Tax=Pseudoduganella flava TaxID=871742 RepID=A0A562Q4J7_9BURK|nr:antibiotic biosynthesis monooxygenase family protein [Pseudoduganella flava]QGZ41670.1 antibiotic biosynthesis monooxygenase [Pseudoduganella flava]TWI51663.1 heme-degrading monooxygenase HmoA [Pseudoduganella flava]
MIYEIAEITIHPGTNAAFEAAVGEAVPLFRRAKGCLSMRLDRTIERPDTYRLVIGWETLEHHTVDFRGSADFQAWRGLVGGFFAEPPKVEHTENAVSGF